LAEKDETKDKKGEILDKYNHSSAFYDKRYKHIQFGKFRIILNKKLLQGDLFLDLGCGTGLLLDFLKKNEIDMNFFYFGIDISIGMLKNFNKKLEKDKNQNRKKKFLVLADLEHLPFRENCFDTVFSFTTFQNLPSIPKGFKELIYVAKNNSVLIFSMLRKAKNREIFFDEINKNLRDIEIILENSTEDILVRGYLKKNYY
jgi:ubiquinone/menaquinone biosynthesis C-methylase UbiE